MLHLASEASSPVLANKHCGSNPKTDPTRLDMAETINPRACRQYQTRIQVKLRREVKQLHYAQRWVQTAIGSFDDLQDDFVPGRSMAIEAMRHDRTSTGLE
jgi:hypothetical protein